MRNTGRSLAKVIGVLLLVLSILMWIGFAGVVIGAVALVAGTDLGVEITNAGELLRLPNREGMLLVMVLAGVTILLAITLVLRLRKVVLTVERGEPFHPDNPGDLRVIACLLAATTVTSMVSKMVGPLDPGPLSSRFDFDLSSWLAVLIIFVLAEVFREGARLRAEAELTV